MIPNFETWVMRGLVLGLLGVCGAFIWREITSKDNIWKTVSKNREANELAIAEARRQFTESLEKIAGQFRSSNDAVNITLGALSQAIGRLDATMAREFASKADLKEVKDDLKRDMDRHIESCPAKCER